MKSTALSLRDTLFECKPLTQPAAMDYGFHSWLYTSRRHAIPSERQLLDLIQAYTGLLNSMTPNQLHQALRKQKLRLLLLQTDSSLVWVQYLNE